MPISTGTPLSFSSHHALDHRVPLLVHRVEHAHRQLLADARLVGRDAHDRPLVDLPQLRRPTSHAVPVIPPMIGYWRKKRWKLRRARFSLSAVTGTPSFTSIAWCSPCRHDRSAITRPVNSSMICTLPSSVIEVLLVADVAVQRDQRLRDQLFAAALALPEAAVLSSASSSSRSCPRGVRSTLRTVQSMVKSRFLLQRCASSCGGAVERRVRLHRRASWR